MTYTMVQDRYVLQMQFIKQTHRISKQLHKGLFYVIDSQYLAEIK